MAEQAIQTTGTAPRAERAPAETKLPMGNGGNGTSAPQAPPPPTGETEEKKEPMNPAKKGLIAIIVAVALIAAIIWGLGYYHYSQTHVGTDDAYVTGDLVNVSPIVSGSLVKLTKQEGDIVKKGELIARLDDSGPLANLQQAKQALISAQSQIPQAQAGLNYQIASTNANIQHAEAAIQAQNARVLGARAQQDLTSRTLSSQINQAQTQVTAAQAQAAQVSSQLAGAQANLSAMQQGVTTARHAADVAAAGTESAQANLDKTRADDARYAALLKQDAVTQQQYDVVHAAFLTAQAQLRGARQQVQQAKSQVAQQQAAARQAAAAVNSARQAAAAARDQVKVASAGVNLAQANAPANSVQQTNVENSANLATQATADLATAKAGNEQVNMKREAINTLKAQVAQAQAAYDAAKVLENDTYIYAPSDGKVVKKAANEGSALSPGQTILTMTKGGDVWVNANFKETQLRDVLPGQPVEVAVDAFPGKVFHGKVQSINEATGASTALLPPDNATGNFTKVVQRITAKIVLVPAANGDDKNAATAEDIANLRQGMSVNAAIDTSKN